MASLQRGIGRLIDSFAEGLIDRPEFEPRIAGLKARILRLRERRQHAVEAAEAERELTLIIGRLDEFATKVRGRLDELDFPGMQDIIRTLVRRIEIDASRVEIVFRVPPPFGGSGDPPPTGGKRAQTWQLCTSESRENHRLAEPMPPPAKDWECLNRNGLAFLRWASIRLMVRKLCQTKL
jgi:site-specific DNA recombinase